VPGVALEGGAAFNVLLDAVVAAQAAGELRPGDPMQHAVFSWSGVHGLSSLLIEDCLAPLGVTDAPDDHARRLVGDLIDGLAPRKK
jgi:hypothetical protein